MRRLLRRRCRLRRLGALVLWTCGLAPAAASAQTTTTSNVSLQQYQPTPFSDRALRLDGSGVLPFGQYRVGLDVDYALRPLVLVDESPAISQAGAPGPDHHLIEHAVGASVLASFGLGHRLEAGLVVPLTLFQSGEAVAGVPRPSAAGLGNVQLGVKARLLAWRGLGVGAAVLVDLPGGVGAFTHESGFGGAGRLFADVHLGRLSFGARAGLRLRAERNFYDVTIGNQLDFAAGAGLQVAAHTSLLAELAGATAAGNPFGNTRQSPTEVLAGVRQRLGKTWLTLAGGPGLLDGYGSPIFRVVAGLTWANRPPDADGDGIPDDDDLCPADAEDKDGFEDGDGCPDPDNDKDGILDRDDRCPNDAEDKDGFEDSDGCPDPDNDKDGIPDARDKCPNQPETVNGFEDDDGCPDAAPAESDKDKDGIPDDKDECPEEAEDKDGFEDDDGCPDLDNDKDGIPDAQDKCPLEPETINGIEDEDGCPDKGRVQVRLGTNEIETLQPIYFDTDHARVRHAFYSIMGQIALLMKAHPEIGRCAIEGHTDDTGPAEWNQKLSVLRAQAVIEFLAGKGVDPKRLVAIGHGEHLPWASNETPWGRARNRRVVFHIEGVDTEDRQKQEQRQERRWRIRHEREKHDRDKKDDKKNDKKNERKDATAPERQAPPPRKAAGAVPASPAVAAPKPTPVPATTPAQKPSPSLSPSLSPPLSPPEKLDDGRAIQKPPPAAREKKPAPPDGGGPPPTLQDLLKLPPR